VIPESVHRGLARQRTVLETRLSEGEAQVGWKVGFGSAAGLQALRLDGPIIGHLLGSGELADGQEVDTTGYAKAVIEAEIACWIGADMPPDVEPAEVDRFVRSVGPALEVADVDHAPEDPERILAGNIFHRGFVLGSGDPSLTLAGAADLSAAFRHGDELIPVSDPEELTGHLPSVLARAARLAPSLGRPIAEGDVILLGSIIAPRPVAPGDVVRYDLGGFPPLRLAFR
jgi:2-keto-4-pentenoate hydratase